MRTNKIVAQRSPWKLDFGHRMKSTLDKSYFCSCWCCSLLQPMFPEKGNGEAAPFLFQERAASFLTFLDETRSASWSPATRPDAHPPSSHSWSHKRYSWTAFSPPMYGTKCFLAKPWLRFSLRKGPLAFPWALEWGTIPLLLPWGRADLGIQQSLTSCPSGLSTPRSVLPGLFIPPQEGRTPVCWTMRCLTMSGPETLPIAMTTPLLCERGFSNKASPYLLRDGYILYRECIHMCYMYLSVEYVRVRYMLSIGCTHIC